MNKFNWYSLCENYVHALKYFFCWSEHIESSCLKEIRTIWHPKKYHPSRTDRKWVVKSLIEFYSIISPKIAQRMSSVDSVLKYFQAHLYRNSLLWNLNEENLQRIYSVRFKSSFTESSNCMSMVSMKYIAGFTFRKFS